MPTTGDDAPDFTAPLADGGIQPFTLSDHLPAEAPIVLAFFPGAFTAVCSHEMATFEERLEDFEGTVYGVGADSPFALNEFRDTLDLSFGLIADYEKEVIEAYDVATDFAAVGIDSLPKRAVFVVDGNGTVAYDWVAADPTNEPDYDAVAEAVAEAR